MLCPQKLPNRAYRTRKIVSAERYIDVSHTEHRITCQTKAICCMRELSIKHANCNQNFATWPFSHQKNA